MKMEVDVNFYRFSQNNSGGHFDVDDNVAHVVVIQAMSEEHAIKLIEPMIEDQSGSCACCGDRWYLSPDMIEEGDHEHDAEVYTHYKDVLGEWNRKFGDFEKVEEPKYHRKEWGTSVFGGKVKTKTIVEYCQFYTNNWGWTTPDTIIHYLDGTKKEIFKPKEANNE